MLSLSIRDNLLLPNYDMVSSGFSIDSALAETAVQAGVETLQIKVGDVADRAETLSGGNQQKVVIAKWLIRDPDILLLNGSICSIDVGTKQDSFRLMRASADAGKAIMFYSTDYAELIGCCDRVSILYGGKVLSELEGEALTEGAIVSGSLNIHGEAAA